MLYYVKRCVALPGDTLEMQNGYYKIKGVKDTAGYLSTQKETSTPSDNALDISISSFPWDKKLDWTVREFGPLPVPGRDDVVRMDSLSWLLYHQLINWEQKHSSRLGENNSVYIGDSLIREYRFKENYYFMAGDNTCNSQDSRYWGLLPEKFIVGRVIAVWKSKDENTGKIRWNRILKRIK